ncbi:MAG TPA: hypothetical protein PLM85_08930 [Nitrosomonas sp.]|nr:hypothetical protein [Nitrosomonas sp.]
MHFKVSEYQIQGQTFKGSTIVGLRTQPNGEGKFRQKKIISVDRFAKDLPPEARALIDDSEYQQYLIFKEKHDKKYREEQLQIAIDYLTTALLSAAQGIKEGLRPSHDISGAWTALDGLTAALQAADLMRPKRPRGRPSSNGSHDVPEDAVIPNLLEQGTDTHKLLQFLTNKLNHANYTIKQLQMELEQLKHP